MALVYLRELNQETKFAIWKIEESTEELLSKLQLDDNEQDKLRQLSKGKRTLHWLATRVLLRYLLQTDNYINCPSDTNGKPYLPDFPYKISLTHSYEYAGVMLSTKGECGMDLELVMDKVVRIKEKFLKPEELEFIQPEQDVLQLYACWCAKEAVYKLQGNKGVSFLEDMTIKPFNYKPQGVMTLDLRKDGLTNTYQVYYEEFQNYMLGYAVE
ncbi:MULTISPECIES: 4'-phosphopantetheinyl transferase family protein [Sphingobacterium]|uniref:4'-phosphopantetheinyl transferase superfamily protein n=1 Tax=Sphingobacterium litopenaei TaxID=2763500 RepID=A0ABR7YHY7_9SPHI|nr:MULTISPECIES: 4'-phosphopantetheinyl transferase superfamily protein [Sphingobacterium]MBD1430929.1 4'-phosphopantetheinyl transferase superfamily protein [Sphingobacterium litopenaei]NGM74460.1 4'-phosphopantetheinyl transferase superfamily protein [Sphingobacterium sp. SGL-16]